MSQPAATDRCANSPSVPRSAFMDRSSLSSNPSNPISPRMISAMTLADSVAGNSLSIAS